MAARRTTAQVVASDVATIHAHALAVITIHPNGSIKVTQNLKGQLSVVAVVGPGVLGGKYFEAAVLTEVGLRRALPFHSSGGSNFYELRNGNGHGRKREKKVRHIPARHRWFSLTQEQYRRVAPTLFRTIQEIAERRISLWEVGSGTSRGLRIVREASPRMQRRGVSSFTRKRVIPLAIRASFPDEEEQLIRDVYWAEMHNPNVIAYLTEFSCWIVKWLHMYPCGYRRSFRTLRGFQGVSRLFQNSHLPYYLKVEALKHLPQGRHYPFYGELAELLRWTGRPTREHRLIALAGNARRRVGNFRVRTYGYRKGLLITHIQKREPDDNCPF